MISQEGLAALARLVRAMPRNPDLMILDRAIKENIAASLTQSNTLDSASNKRFDRKTYMRDYMRKKRASCKTSI